MTEETKISPMMIQWQHCKEAAKEAILLFRLGDFYEAFHDDAVILSKELNLTLTKRQDIPMSGIPYHTAEGYIDKLVAKGYRVAVAEQTEDPQKAKGIVHREVARIVTPGTLITSSLLSDKTSNFFAAIGKAGKLFGLAFLDLTTSEFWVSEFTSESDLLNDLYRLKPAEILTSSKIKEGHPNLFSALSDAHPFLLNTLDEWHFEHRTTYDFLIQHFKIHNLDGFGLTGMTASISAAGALLNYLKNTLHLSIQHIFDLRPYSTHQFLILDLPSQRNLEITESLQDGSKKFTLLSVLDRTLTPMGARLLRHWIKQPLLSISDITERQMAIQYLWANSAIQELLKNQLYLIRDLERLMMRISSGYATPRDLLALSQSLNPIVPIKQALADSSSLFLRQASNRIEPLPSITQLIHRALVDEPPAKISDGGVFREGYHQELDELRGICRDSKEWMVHYQSKLREETGIKTLKVGFTRIFGYYIEVSRGQSEKMPDTFIRRQTLVNAERYITPELKEYESKALNAEERIHAIENELFHQLKQQIIPYARDIQRTAQAIAQIDSIYSLTDVAQSNNYVCPLIDEGSLLQIEEGRHPVIELSCLQEKFIPNDTLINNLDQQLLLITGPNMAGKSTYLRQTALIVIMAQIGSFVPAKAAKIGVVDQVFTRIGASDNLSRGQSTFMVEMTETANILHNATSRSLIILDEIGRGTSTYDGISIAWSIAEYLLLTENKKAKTLFATHYWELTKLEEMIYGAVNYHVAVHESGEEITFLRKIIRGGTDKSYGIHVGRLAGLPHTIIARAQEILNHLEESVDRKNIFNLDRVKRRTGSKIKPQNVQNVTADIQLTFF